MGIFLAVRIPGGDDRIPVRIDHGLVATQRQRAVEAGPDFLILGAVGEDTLGSAPSGIPGDVLCQVRVVTGEEPDRAGLFLAIGGHRLGMIAGRVDAEHAGVRALQMLPELGFGFVGGEMFVGHVGLLLGSAAITAQPRQRSLRAPASRRPGEARQGSQMHEQQEGHRARQQHDETPGHHTRLQEQTGSRSAPAREDANRQGGGQQPEGEGQGHAPSCGSDGNRRQAKPLSRR